jgi:hypothetical protein
MTRTAIADRIKQAFLDSLKSLGASVETMGQLVATKTSPEVRRVFERLGQAGRNVYLVRGIGLINVHVRSEPPGWWNVLTTVKEDIDALRKVMGIRCYYVLLIGRADRFVADGYIAADFQTKPFVKYPGIEATKYTINEKQHLDTSELLLSVEKVAKVLLDTSRET